MTTLSKFSLTAAKHHCQVVMSSGLVEKFLQRGTALVQKTVQGACPGLLLPFICDNWSQASDRCKCVRELVTNERPHRSLKQSEYKSNAEDAPLYWCLWCRRQGTELPASYTWPTDTATNGHRPTIHSLLTTTETQANCTTEPADSFAFSLSHKTSTI